MQMHIMVLMTGCLHCNATKYSSVTPWCRMFFSCLYFIHCCPATVSCDMKYVYISIILFFESPHECWFKSDNTCTIICTLKPNPSL
jgi:hypothetical protein